MIRTPREQGVTLIEMMVVTLLIALMAGISFPAVTSGVDTLRLNGAARDVATFFSSGLNRAERRQEAVQIVISPAAKRLWMLSAQPGSRQELQLPDSVSIENILPPVEQPGEGARSFFLYPGGTVPAMGVVLKSRRGAIRMVRVDPITGVPQVTAPAAS